MLTRNPDTLPPVLPDWPRIAPDEGVLANRLAVPREALCVALGAQTVVVEFEAADGPRFAGLDIPFVLGADRGSLRLADGALAHLAEASGLEALPLRAVSPAAALLLEWVLLDLLKRIEASGTGELHIAPDESAGSAAAALPGTYRLHGTLRFDGAERHPFRLELTPALASRLAAAREALSPLRLAPFGDLPIPLAISVGQQRLTVREIGELRPGDVVMLADERLTLRVGPHHEAGLERAANGYRLTGALGRPRTKAQDESSMSDASTDGDGLETVPIGLVFEVGRLEMPLGELRQLGVGSLLPLDRPDDQLVEILANGRRIGRGTLVRIGEGLGLRVVQLSHG